MNESSFFGIETMRRAILTHRRVMDVIGHNLANASTPGYTRQVAILQATDPSSFPGMNNESGMGQLGTGVFVKAIQRVRDMFVDNQIRIGASNSNQLTVEKSALQRVENAFLEPSTSEGLSDVITKFYNAWQDLSLNPDGVAQRSQVVNTARNLVDTVKNIDQSLRDIRSDLNGQLRDDVKEVNRISDEIATLNGEIGQVITHGDAPNDLMDKRDSLIDELAKYMDITVSTTTNDMVAIHVGTRQLIADTTVFHLSDDLAWDHPSQQTQTPFFSDVTQDDFTMLANFSKGELKGIINARDQYVPETQKKFQDIMSTFVNEINALQSSGFGMRQFTLDLGLTTTSAIVISPPPLGVGDNSVTVSATDNINVGDTLRIEEPDTAEGDGIAVTVKSIVGNTIYFDTLPELALQKARFAGDILNTYTVAAGSKIFKINDPKNNFFQMENILPDNFKGDNVPKYDSTMISTITLDEDITEYSTIKDIENRYGIDITNAVAGLSLNVDNLAKTPPITEGMTLGTFLQKFNELRPPTSDGQKIELTFDTVNHRLVLQGHTIKALSELGGKNGSDLNLFRIFGFEGQHITGFQMNEGTSLDATTLGSVGVSDGWFMVDGVSLQADRTLSIKQNITNWNNAMNSVPESTSQHTQFFYDPTERRIKIISDHQFSVRDAINQPFMAVPFMKSNFLTQMGFRDAEGEIAISVDQQKASITTSDTTARLEVNEKLIGDVNLVATARNAAGTPGDNWIAVAIGATRNKLVLNNTDIGFNSSPTETIEEAYDASIGELGATTQRVEVDLEVANKFNEYYQQRREEVSGVSIDEEMTKLVEAQHAFNAASRMLTVIDEMLDKIINGMGTAGR